MSRRALAARVFKRAADTQRRLQVTGLNVDGAHPARNCLKPHESRDSEAVTKGCDEQVRAGLWRVL